MIDTCYATQTKLFFATNIKYNLKTLLLNNIITQNPSLADLAYCITHHNYVYRGLFLCCDYLLVHFKIEILKTGVGNNGTGKCNTTS